MLTNYPIQFKIQEAGLLSGTVGKGFWAAEKMQNDNSTWTTVIPASVPSGAYLLRSETIAIHSVPSVRSVYSLVLGNTTF
jgi:hypothetical protein